MSLGPLKSEQPISGQSISLVQKDTAVLEWENPHISEEQGDYKANTGPSVIERLDLLKAEAWNTSAKLQVKKLRQLTELMQQSGEGPLSADIFKLYASEISNISDTISMCVDGLWSHIDDEVG